MKIKWLFFPIMVCATLMLSACDSSGDSSSGSTVANVVDDFSAYAGSYQGVVSVEYSASSLGVSAVREESATVVIDDNGNANIRVGDYQQDVQLNSDRIVATRNVDVTYSDYSCTGVVNLEGTIANERIDGVANGTGNCSNGGVSSPVTLRSVMSLQKL